MLKRNKFLIGFVSLGIFAVATSLIPLGTIKGIQNTLHAESCSHVGNHYTKKDSTCEVPGNEEFWACCKCHEQFLEEPDGSWTDSGQYSGVLEEGHIAFIPCHKHNIDPNDKIGYKTLKCEKCEDTIVLDQLMTLDDVKFYLAPEEEGHSTKSYGCGFNVKNSLTWAVVYPVTENKASSAVRPLKEDGNPDYETPTKYMYYCLQPKDNISYAGVSSIYIPRVDCKAYKEVVYNIKTNTDIKLGFSSDSIVEFPIYGDATVSIVITNIEDIVRATILSNKDSSLFKTIEITDEDIINGSKSIELFVSTKAYGNICLSVGKLASEHTHSVYFTDMDLLGCEGKCSTCGADVPDTKFETIDLSNKLYGASITNKDGKTCSVSNNSGKILYSFGVNDEQNQYTINFPRVNYKGYKEVVFDLHIPSGWFTFGFSSDVKSNTIKDATYGTLEVIEQIDGSYKAFLKISSSQGIHADLDITIDDEAVLSGEKGLAMWAQAGNTVREIRITGIHLNNECTHDYAYNLGDCISDSVTSIGCYKCGKEDTSVQRPIETSDINYSLNHLGSKIEYLGEMGWNIPSKVENAPVDAWKEATKTTYTSSTIDYKPGINGADFKISLPKVDYSKFSKIEYPMSVSYGAVLHYGVGFKNSVWGDAFDSNSTAKNGTLTIEIIGLNELKATLSILDNTVTETLSISEEVFTGKDSLPMYVSTNGTDVISLGRPTLTLHKHVPSIDFTCIGQATAPNVCAICGETYDCTFDDKSVNLRENSYGLSIRNISDSNPSKGVSISYSGTNPVRLQFGEKDINDKFEISLPKINYSVYSNVSLKLMVDSAWFKIGFNESEANSVKTDHLECDLVIEKVSEEYKASFIYKGTDGDNFTLTTVISDSEILNGQKSLTLFVQNSFNTPPRVLDFVSITLTR